MRSRCSLLLTFGLLAIAACSGAEPSKKVPLTVCEDGDEACAKAKDNRPKSGKNEEETPKGPTGSPVPGEEPKEEPTADAGSPPTDASTADAALGTSCTALDKCCAQLVAQGYDPATCKSVVSTKNEAACFAQHDRYKQFGDCS